MPIVRDYMDDDPATVKLDTKAEDVARLLGEQELHGVPVVNEARRCVGIVTENDLVMAD
jgi:CBS domain-containing protein